MNLLLRVVLVLAGLVFAASVAVVGALTFALWGLHAAWARLTGRAVSPFILRVHPFGAMARGAAPAGRRARAGDALAGRLGDVTDVEPKPPLR